MYKLYVAAAAAAKSLQSCLTLCDPIDGSPPGSSIPGNLQARILEWVAISFSKLYVEYSIIAQQMLAWIIITNIINLTFTLKFHR